MTNGSTSKVESVLTMECPSPKMSFLEDYKLSDLKLSVLRELKFKVESGEQSQATG